MVDSIDDLSLSSFFSHSILSSSINGDTPRIGISIFASYISAGFDIGMKKIPLNKAIAIDNIKAKTEFKKKDTKIYAGC